MPNMDNAKKALRQSKKRATRNQIAKDSIHSLRVAFRKAIAAKKTEEAATLARSIGKSLDKAVAKGIMKLNTVSRTKSRMMKNLNATVKTK